MNFSSIIRNRREKIEQLRKKVKSDKEVVELSRETSYLYSLLEITNSISGLQDSNTLLELIVDSAIILTKAERGFLMSFRKDGDLEFKVMRNIDKKTLDGEGFRISRSVVNQVLATEESIFLSDIYKDKKFKISESIVTLGLHMVMCVPLRLKKRLSGVLYLDSHSEAENFTPLEMKILEAFAAQASVAIENNYLYDSSVHDALTGLYNFSYLRNRLEEEIVRAPRYKKGNISFMMLDLDNFKLVNDAYGHIFGNTILVKVAESFRKTVRKYEVIARYGGDEFAILMPDTDANDARFIAERLQKEIADLKFSIGKEVFSITLSIGISTFPADQAVNSENIVVEADHALFIAKSKGGNQIAMFGSHKDIEGDKPTLIGKSKAIEDVRQMISKFARTDATVLITGETGTGKELIAIAMHKQSACADKPLVVVNCGAIPDNLLESELFGYEKGAFTGAYMQRRGKLELAHGGTIFFDEIGELPLHLQVKILRTLEQKEIDRIGGKAPIKVDVRVIAATNKNLEEEMKQGRFRKDLFYRLSVATIFILPLRERVEDIEVLSKYYLDQVKRKYRREFLGFTKEGIEAMMHHSWPGNVRELFHRIERAVILGTGQYLDENDLGLASPQFRRIRPLKVIKDELVEKSILYALESNHWNITHASKALAISQKALRYLMQRYKIVKSGTLD